MGISQEVFTIYGWEVDTNNFIIRWLEEIDYVVPDGVILHGMDLDKIMIGPILFRSGDARWEPLEGFESFSEEEAEFKMNVWQANNNEFYAELQVLCQELKKKPKFYTFVNYS